MWPSAYEYRARRQSPYRTGNSDRRSVPVGMTRKADCPMEPRARTTDVGRLRWSAVRCSEAGQMEAPLALQRLRKELSRAC